MKSALTFVRGTLAITGLLALFACSSISAPNETNMKVLRVVPQSDLDVFDPIWSSTYITRDHGYLIYDTLFGTDASGQILPQMVGTYEQSADKKTWTFTLRDGLEFHDGKPVTSEDVIASLKRWGQKDIMGQKLMSFVESWETVNPQTIQMKLREPYGLVLESLGKPSSNVPFIMPKRVADTPVEKQIADWTGSGPFIYKKDESRPGEKVVYVRNAKYKPRAGPASGTAGGKVVKLDRVEWVIIKDAQTATNALIAGEVDMIESPAFEQYSSLERNPDIQMVVTNPLGSRFFLRFNHLQPPFNNPKVRRAAMAALNQLEFLKTQVGIRARYRTCFSVYPCNTPYFTNRGMDFIANPDPGTARQMLKDSGYDGTPVVLLQPTDLAVIAKLPLVASQLLREAGFKVDTQAMDWPTMTARLHKTDGWSIFLSGLAAVDEMNPIVNSRLSGACDKAYYGWPCDPELEKLRDQFARSLDDKSRKAIAEQVQVRAMEIGAYVPLGDYEKAVAARKNISGFVTGYMTVFWNVEKK